MKNILDTKEKRNWNKIKEEIASMGLGTDTRSIETILRRHKKMLHWIEPETRNRLTSEKAKIIGEKGGIIGGPIGGPIGGKLSKRILTSEDAKKAVNKRWKNTICENCYYYGGIFIIEEKEFKICKYDKIPIIVEIKRCKNFRQSEL